MIWRDDRELLVGEGFDAVKGQRFYRPLGGRIEFGELGAETIRRELLEELGAEVEATRYLGTLENVFEYEGAPGHELVRVYEAEPLDSAFRATEIHPRIDQEAPSHALWKRLDSFGDDPLHPHGLLELLDADRPG